jgi:outer membrane protein assembly factor BamD
LTHLTHDHWNHVELTNTNRTIGLPVYVTLLLALFVTSTTQAQVPLDRVVESIGKLFPGFVSDRENCPEPPKPIEGLNAEQLFAKGEALLSKSQVTCEAARYFFEILRQYPDSSLYAKSQLRYIEALRKAGDFNGAINEANRFLEFRWQSPSGEEAHYQIVLAVKEQLVGPKLSQTWAEYALGIGPGQNEGSPFILNLSFQSFLDRYPNSTRAAEVLGYQTAARNSLAAHFLEVGIFYFKKGSYKAAIGRFRYIAQNGRLTSSFEPAMYYMIMSYRFFAQAVRSGKINDQKLAELMEAKPGERVSREEVAAKAEASANHLEGEMKQHLPQSEWTKKLAR